jgi:hypothetical protein
VSGNCKYAEKQKFADLGRFELASGEVRRSCPVLELESNRGQLLPDCEKTKFASASANSCETGDCSQFGIARAAVSA